MGYSAVTITDAQSVDVVSPGAPAFAAKPTQIDNKKWSVSIIMPSADADGSELTEMKTVTLATLPMSEGVHPFVGLPMPDIKLLPGVVLNEAPTSPSDAGTTLILETAILNLGGWQAFAVAVTD